MADGLFGTSTPLPQLQQTRLQPAGVSSAPMVRPQQVQTGSNLRALADALGGLNTALNNWANVDDAIKDDPNSQINKEWIAKAQQMSRDELLALSASGEADGHRAREDALHALLGDRATADFIPEMETFFATEFDRSTGDVAAEYDRRREEYAASLPDEISRAAFYKQTEAQRMRLIGGITDERIANTKQQINATIVDGWYVKIGEAAKDGTIDPAEVAEAVFGASNDNAAFFGLSGPEQDATIWALAQRLAADGKVDEAEALLNTPRKGPNGADLPPLSSIPKYAVEGKGLIASAKTVKAGIANEDSVSRRTKLGGMVADGTLTLEDIQPEIDSGLFTESQASSMLLQAENNRKRAQTEIALTEAAARAEQEAVSVAAELMAQPGGVNKIVDVKVPTTSGSAKTLSREEQIELVRQREEVKWARAEEKLVADGTDPAQAKKAINDARQGWYISQFLPNEEWQRSFASLPGMVTPIALEKNPALAGKAAEIAEQYLDLRAKSPVYAATLLSPAAKDFLESYALAREVSDLPPEEALASAAGITAMTPFEKVKTELPKDDRDKLIKQVFRESADGTDGYQAEPYGAGRMVIEAQINRMSALGVPAEAMGERLKKWVSDSTISVNGVLVPVEGGMETDFPVLVDRHLSKVFEERKETLMDYGIDDPSDLSIAPVNGGKSWAVIDKTTGLPLGFGTLDSKALSAVKKERQSEIDAEIAANVAAADADAADRRKAYEERIEWYDLKIAQWSKHGALGKRAAESLKAERQDYINSSNPAWVKDQFDKEQSETRTEARRNAFLLGMDDPFPEDGAIPDDWKREANEMERRWGKPILYPEVE